MSCASLEADPSWVPDPVLIAEVLSPSTATRDRSTKLANYRRLPSLREILLISSRERRVEHWQRSAEAWTVRDLIGEAELRLDAIDAAIPLAVIYEGTAV